MEKINIVDFQKRKLNDFYITVYVITKEIKIRAESCITNKTLYVLAAMDILGNRQILGIYFDSESNNRFWLEKFEELKSRGLNKILFFITPPHQNIERCIKIIYNNIHIIKSPDSTYSNITRFFAEKSSRKMSIALKDLFLQNNIENYKIKLELFKEIYIENKLIKMLLEKEEKEIENFYKYDYELRKLLYPYYVIRELKKSLNKLKTKEKLCTNLNEVIETAMPCIHTFETERSYSKIEWLELISKLYEEYNNELEEYINGQKNIK